MAISTARRRGRAVPAVSVAPEPDLPPEPLPIGLPDLDVANCPVCGRPIAVGAWRCPGCSTRLLLGVPARRAATFVVVGLVAGLLLGGGATAAVVDRGASGDPNGQQAGIGLPPASGSPGASSGPGSSVAVSPIASVAPSPVPSTGVPSQAAAAIRQLVVTNDRLASRASELRAELAAPAFDSFAVATTLRAMTADAVVGRGLVPLAEAWPVATSTARDLDDYYALVGATAGETLASSLSDPAAYKAGAQAMLDLLGRLDPLRGATQALVAQTG
jgi:hypothetical protein